MSLELLSVLAYAAGGGGAAGVVTVTRANEPDPEPVECPIAGDFIPSVGGRVWVETGTGSWVALAPELAPAVVVPDTYPRGMIFRHTTTGDWILSTTPGVESTIAQTDPWPVVGNRIYEVKLFGAHSVITGGSGFSVGDYWEFWLEREVNSSGSWAEFPSANVAIPAHVRIRANVAIAMRFPLPVLIGLYIPAISANVAFRAQATKGAGASTVTTNVGTNSGASPIGLTVTDVGTA